MTPIIMGLNIAREIPPGMKLEKRRRNKSQNIGNTSKRNPIRILLVVLARSSSSPGKGVESSLSSTNPHSSVISHEFRKGFAESAIALSLLPHSGRCTIIKHTMKLHFVTTKNE
jgi:hypothetical protein